MGEAIVQGRMKFYEQDPGVKRDVQRLEEEFRL
jgi:hypothetical protein